MSDLTLEGRRAPAAFDLVRRVGKKAIAYAAGTARIRHSTVTPTEIRIEFHANEK